MKIRFIICCCCLITTFVQAQITAADLDSCSKQAGYFDVLVTRNSLIFTRSERDGLLHKPTDIFAGDSSFQLGRSRDTVYFTKKHVPHIIYRHSYSFNDSSVFERLIKQAKALRYSKGTDDELNGVKMNEYRCGPWIMLFQINNPSGRFRYTVTAHASPK